MFSFLANLVARWAPAIVVLSLVLAIIAGVYGSGIFSSLNSESQLTIPGSESDAVSQDLMQSFGSSSANAILMFTTDGQDITSPAVSHEITRLLSEIPGQPTTVSYYSTGNQGFISKDKTQTFGLIDIQDGQKTVTQKLEEFIDQNPSDLVTIQAGGATVAEQQTSRQIEEDLKKAELISLPLVALLLLFFFRSVVAASLPVILGVASIVGGLAVVRMLTNVTDIDQYAINVITVLGLGLAVDYSLLMVNRYREERQAGADDKKALRVMVMTAGRTILFSGLTVMFCLLVLTVFPVDFLRSVGIGGVSALFVAITAALVVLPALLALIGPHIDALTLPGRRNSKDRHTIWLRTGGFALKHPLITLSLSLALIIVVAWPFKNVTFTDFDYHSLPKGSSSQAVAEDLAINFSGQGPTVAAMYYLKGPAADSVGAIYNMREQLSQVTDITAVDSPVPPSDQMSAEVYQNLLAANQLPQELQALWARYTADDLVLFTLHTNLPSSDQGVLVADLRQINSDSGDIKIGGSGAQLVDLLSALADELPLAMGLMAIAIFVLFVLMLQSVVIPIKTIIINAVALLASFGVLTAVFQNSVLGDSFFAHTYGITPTIPILIFAVAFGLSMDYAAFLYGRMHEEFLKTKDNDRSVLVALDKTGGIITAAALLLVTVVGTFVFSKIPLLQQVGLGMAVAVFIDAFIVRMFLVPSVMKLIGEANWWSPSFVKRFKISHQ